MTFQLSDRAKELIPKARIVSFDNLGQPTSGEPNSDRQSSGHAWNSDSIARFQAADDAGRYLTDEDFAALETEAKKKEAESTVGIAAARFLRDNAEEIVTTARQQVLDQYPGITAPGGDLFPAIRAEACWRDFWHFLRCVTYGLASGREFTSAEGLHYMNLLYIEMNVPLGAMVTGLEALKQESLQRHAPAQTEITACFNHLIEKMQAFTANLEDKPQAKG